MTLVETSFSVGAGIGLIVFMFYNLRSANLELGKIREEVRTLKRLELRRTVTFLKIENDIQALSGSVLSLAKADPDTISEIEAILSVRHQRLKSQITDMLGEAPIRGLEFPSRDDDPWFWSEFGLDQMVPEADSDNVGAQ